MNLFVIYILRHIHWLATRRSYTKDGMLVLCMVSIRVAPTVGVAVLPVLKAMFICTSMGDRASLACGLRDTQSVARMHALSLMKVEWCCELDLLHLRMFAQFTILRLETMWRACLCFPCILLCPLSVHMCYSKLKTTLIALRLIIIHQTYKLILISTLSFAL